MNSNRERLLEFCTTYDLVIGGTIFPHHEIHKLTWCFPNERDKNQIGRLMINGTRRRLHCCRMSGSEETLMSVVTTNLSRQT